MVELKRRVMQSEQKTKRLKKELADKEAELQLAQKVHTSSLTHPTCRISWSSPGSATGEMLWLRLWQMSFKIENSPEGRIRGVSWYLDILVSFRLPTTFVLHTI